MALKTFLFLLGFIAVCGSAQELLCTWGQNSLGKCAGCEGQLFISDDCSEGFYCSTQTPNTTLYDGCVKRCEENEILIADIPNTDWYCVPRTDTNITCPGKFNIQCPDDDIGHHFNSSMCECDSQLFVSGDCREAFYCRSRMVNGGQNITCGPNQIVDVNLQTYSWDCSDKEDRCPGLGGFKVGCEGGRPTPPPPPVNVCTFANNTIGACRCNEQLFVNEECSGGFYCLDNLPEEHKNKDGCLLECDEGLVMDIDIPNMQYKCLPKDEANFKCPGKFNMDCLKDDDSIHCHCQGELWITKGCHKGFYCAGEQLEDGTNPGSLINCADDEIVEVSLGNPSKWNCTKNIDKCPDGEQLGGFHVGCTGGDSGNSGQNNVATYAVSILALSLVFL